MSLDRSRDALRYGVFYTLAKSDIESPTPINATRTWRFWTKHRNRFTKFLAENYPPQFIARHIIDATSHSRNLGDIIDHYDVSSDFFLLFLDEGYHFYSCGDFRSPTDTLEQAQINKAQHFLSLLAPKPGDNMLELGCGWGAMMKFLRDRIGDSVTLKGITISNAQARFICQNYGFDIAVENFVTREYQLSQYDHIYSMGAWEHVRPQDVAPLLKKLYGALKPRGRLVQQFSCAERPHTPATFLLGELFFSGFVLMTLQDQIAAAEAAGFRLLHDSIHDYRPSWKAWYDRLAMHRDEAVRLVGVREYNLYLMLFVLAWKFIDEKYATVHRLAFEKPGD